MYPRTLKLPLGHSCILLGPRGVGKSWFLTNNYPQALLFDLLDSRIYTQFMASPHKLSEYIPSDFKQLVIIDEIQKIPALLDEVHRLIAKKNFKFILTGSSARKLKAKDVNLLAGRALTEYMYPLTVEELGKDFSLQKSLKYGHLPMAYTSKTPVKFLSSYVYSYLKEEIQQEGADQKFTQFFQILRDREFFPGGGFEYLKYFSRVFRPSQGCRILFFYSKRYLDFF